jgi:hypothetical protein
MLKLESLEQWHTKLQISTIHSLQLYNIEHLLLPVIFHEIF